MEWLSPVALRDSRVAGTGRSVELPKIAHEEISPEFEDVGSTLTMRTRLLTVVIDRGDLSVHVKSGAERGESRARLARDSGMVWNFGLRCA